MDKKIERAITDLSDRIGLSEKEIKAEMKPYLDKSFNHASALVAVQGDHSMAMRSIKGHFHIFPLKIAEPIHESKTDRNGEPNEYDVMRIISLMYGRVERGGEPIPFITTLSLYDDAIAKAEELKEGAWLAFKGFANPARGTVSLGREEEFQEPTEKLDFAELLLKVIESAIPITSLSEQDDAGNFLHHKEELLTTGFIARVPDNPSSRAPIEIAEIGSEMVTVWPPNEETFEFTEDDRGSRVLVFGWHQIKNGEPNISAKIVVAAPGE